MTVKLLKYLANLGYGSRREVERMIDHGRVTSANDDLLAGGDAFTHDDVRVDGEPLDVPPGSVLLFNKPVDYVCSTKEASRLIYELLPERFRLRTPIIAPVGRLDRDTSGLLLLTDDGQFNHRMTSPKTLVPKVYDVALAAALCGNEAELFASGTMLLESETEPLKPAQLTFVDAMHVQLTLHEGRYHQVRRMFAATGNHVNALHRSAIGSLQLGELESGTWRLLTQPEIAALLQK